jgi:carboxymethylenebutenolidase
LLENAQPKEIRMCYDDNACPSDPGAAGSTSGELIVLRASDGTQFHAFAAMPGGSTVSPRSSSTDVRGLHQFYKELSPAFCRDGHRGGRRRLFRSDGGLTSREEGFEFMPHVEQIKLDTFTQDVKAALAYLREKVGSDASIFVVGFCMGGSLALVTGTNPELGFAGLIPFYAGVKRDFGAGTVLDLAPKVAYPVVGFFGGADQGIPESAVQEIDAKLDQAGVPHRLTIYPGAPHSFFDRRAADYANESADAWQQLLTFIRARGEIRETA